MPNGQHFLEEFFFRLSEEQTRDILRLAGIPDDRPDILRQGGLDSVGRSWIDTHRTSIGPVVLRVVDPTDAELSRLAQEGFISVEVGPNSRAVNVTFYPLASPESDPEYTKSGGVPITDLVVAAGILSELFVALARANRPLGIDMPPPRVTVRSGSVGFTIGGGLFATGVGLLVACSAGLVAAPIVGPLGGVLLAGAGLYDLAIGWKKSISETRAKDAEEKKLLAEAMKLQMETLKVGLEAQKLRSDLQGGEDDDDRFAYSSFVPRPIIRAQAQRWGVSEQYAHHTLNRGLPMVHAAKKYMRDITVEQQ